MKNKYLDVIDQEIEWSRKNTEMVGQKEGEWFVKGLRKARCLIIETAKLNKLMDEENERADKLLNKEEV